MFFNNDDIEPMSSDILKNDNIALLRALCADASKAKVIANNHFFLFSLLHQYCNNIQDPKSEVLKYMWNNYYGNDSKKFNTVLNNEKNIIYLLYSITDTDFTVDQKAMIMQDCNRKEKAPWR